MHLLVNENLNLASGADLQGSVNQLGDLVSFADVGLDNNSLGAISLNLFGDLLSPLSAAV
jgi:hypothetical protein